MAALEEWNRNERFALWTTSYSVLFDRTIIRLSETSRVYGLVAFERLNQFFDFNKTPSLYTTCLLLFHFHSVPALVHICIVQREREKKLTFRIPNAVLLG